jgi:predicted ester cyclase
MAFSILMQSSTHHLASPPLVPRTRRLCGRTRSPPSDLRHNVQEVVVDGDVEMARVVVTGTMRANFAGGSGGNFRIDQAVITHLRDGKMIEAWEIADIAALQAQVAEG